MKRPPLRFRLTIEGLAGVLWAAFCLPAAALTTDKDQPIEVEADQVEIDDMNKVAIYRGNVVVVQGSIRMTGEEMTVYNTEDDELDHLIMEGNPATYQQLPDNSETPDQARAARLEYYELRNLIVLIRDAWVKQEKSTLTGERIEYNTELSRVRAWSQPEGKAPAATPEKKSRVKLIIKRQKDDDSP